MKSMIIVLFCTLLLSVTARALPFGMKDTGPPGIEQVSKTDLTDVTAIDLNAGFVVNPGSNAALSVGERWQTDHNAFIVTNERKQLTRQTTHEIYNKGSTLLVNETLDVSELPAADLRDYPLRC